MLTEPSESDLEHLTGLVGADAAVAAGDDRMTPYLLEPRDEWQGTARVVLKPGNTAEVSKILAHCNQARLPVVAISGGTGLVGGQIYPSGPAPVLISLERMNRVREVRPNDNAMIAEAGCILADIQAAADEVGRLFPLSLASEGSCRIGGNLATNAGGVQVLRYGNTRDLVLGIEAVLADGTVIENLKTLRKNNMGYDLRHLLVGSEGTLGVITAASLKLFPKPGETVTAMLAIDSPGVAVELLHLLSEKLGAGITGFELIRDQGIAFLHHVYPDWRDPLESAPQWRVLLEVAGPAGSDLGARMESVMEQLFVDGIATDGVIAQSETQRNNLWWVRETIPEANRKIGAIISSDCSVPISRIPDFIAQADEAVRALDPGFRTNSFGHIGDGNIHYNIFPPEGRSNADFKNRAPDLKRAVHDLTDQMGGSISAEHGIGRLKKDDLAKYLPEGNMAVMRLIKKALDPNGIMNPGAVIEAS